MNFTETIIHFFQTGEIDRYSECGLLLIGMVIVTTIYISILIIGDNIPPKDKNKNK